MPNIYKVNFRFAVNDFFFSNIRSQLFRNAYIHDLWFWKDNSFLKVDFFSFTYVDFCLNNITWLEVKWGNDSKKMYFIMLEEEQIENSDGI